ncbi:Death ON curing protein (plasmid) [Roseomonas mucosa]|uniref:type II toxin-antitoxin system death-on-curing family toxin n=1 Tax=Roseomonas TaxID=125216 RepID=UPI000C177853|nr:MULTISPECIES: type II toxin-antitoxin system death-on-curing family toxin [Roseomonas]ATR19451.1 type II toxin-antitoxin system death-on-curing family toxin [Roseomonas sp. FDAARGOS_362]UZO94993.1 Death ON curing protein [Roseomonas mucosa]
MSDPEFLEADVVLFLHDQALREYGGIQGVKDEGMLHSALGRPENKLVYADAGIPDLFDLAAAYAYGLAANHPFNDGNKRTAWGCCVLFLKANGVELDVDAPRAVEQMLRLVEGRLDEAAFAAWLRVSRRG